MKRIFGIVPARSGSKGLPGKNIRNFGGKPLLGWAVEGGLKSGVLEKVILMTDSEEYVEIGKKYGAETLWLSPSEVSGDTSHVFDAMKVLLARLAEVGDNPDYVVLLEPTAPMRQPKHIKELVELVVKSNADSGFTVMEVPAGHNAHWQFFVDEQGKPTIVTGEPVKDIIRRRQLLPPLYVRGGSTYVARTDLLLQEKPDMYGDDTKVLIVDRKYQIDLDSEEDWKEAERRISVLNEE